MNVQAFRRSESRRDLFARTLGFRDGNALDAHNAETRERTRKARDAARAAVKAADAARIKRLASLGCKVVRSGRAAS